MSSAIETQPDHSDERPYLGVGVLVWRGEQLLLGRRITEDGEPCWQFPGGHKESGESVIACASREVREETGLTITALNQVAITDRAFSVGYKHYITLFVSSDYESGEAVVMEPDKCDCWRWFDYRELPRPLFEPIEILLSQCDDLYTLSRPSSIDCA